MARLSFMEPVQARGPWLAAHPCDKRITLERYSFTEKSKSDNVTTEWLVWARLPLTGPANVSAFGYRPNARKAHPSLFEGTSPVDPEAECAEGGRQWS